MAEAFGDHGPDEAPGRVEATIRHMAETHGRPAKFHRTITRAPLAPDLRPLPAR